MVYEHVALIESGLLVADIVLNALELPLGLVAMIFLCMNSKLLNLGETLTTMITVIAIEVRVVAVIDVKIMMVMGGECFVTECTCEGPLLLVYILNMPLDALGPFERLSTNIAFVLGLAVAMSTFLVSG